MTSPFPGLGPARRRVLGDEVADTLRNAIVAGQIEAGQRLREDELAAQMSVSRGPIREALLRLEQEGLVVLERHRGARVAALSRVDIDQIFSLRQVLERLAVEWACTHASEEDLAEIEAAMDAFSSLPMADRTSAVAAELDIRFHDGLFRAAHHERLYRSWEGLRSQIYSFLLTRMALRSDYLETWEPDHRELTRKIRNHELDAALKHISLHVEASYAHVISAMEAKEGQPG